MDKAIIKYRQRRQKRLDEKNGVVRSNYDSVDEFRKRRQKRMDIRGEFNENDHPRGKDGKFVKGAGGGGAVSSEAKRSHHSEEGGGGSAKSAGKKTKVPEIKKSKARNHEFDGSEYKGDPGEVKTGRSGNLAPKNDAAKKINAHDAVVETDRFKESGGKEGRESNSLTGFIDENGNLAPKRQQLHDAIVQDFFKDIVPYEGKATMTMSGGGPASGKSFIEKKVRKEFGDDTTITIDPDKLKEKLPGYTDMAIETDDAAAHYHEESSALAKRIYQYALDNNINVVYDGTGDGSVNSVKKKIQAARDAGYAVNGEYVTVDVDSPNGALFRNEMRYQKAKKAFENGESDVPPRKPKEEDVRKIHAAVSDIVPQVANMYDNFTLWDNNQAEGEPRTLVARCKRDGNIVAEKGQEGLVNRFLKKGKAGYRYSNGKIGK